MKYPLIVAGILSALNVAAHPARAKANDHNNTPTYKDSVIAFYTDDIPTSNQAPYSAFLLNDAALMSDHIDSLLFPTTAAILPQLIRLAYSTSSAGTIAGGVVLTETERQYVINNLLHPKLQWTTGMFNFKELITQHFADSVMNMPPLPDNPEEAG